MTIKFTITVGLDDNKPVDRVLAFELAPKVLEDLKLLAKADPGLAHAELGQVIQDVIGEGITEVVGELIGTFPLEDLAPDP